MKKNKGNLLNNFLENEEMLEEVYSNGDQYFNKLCHDISRAKDKILFESYIFKKDTIGDKVIQELISASNRGVDVRIIVDGIGSPNFSKEYGKKLRKESIKFVVYRPLPWQDAGTEIVNSSRCYVREKFSRLHRKVCVIDRRISFLGSMNITSDHASKKNQGNGWSDVSVKISNSLAAKQLTRSFNLAWENKVAPMYRHKKSKVRLNYCPNERKLLNKGLCDTISNAIDRVWIVTGYMSLNREYLNALQQAVKRGVDVRIILSRDCDVKSSRWVSYYNDYMPLLKSGVKILEYIPCILHAKCCIVDNFFMLGSSNLNGRSRDTDLEADIVLSTKQAKIDMEKYFKKIMQNCTYIQSRKDIKKIPIYATLLGVLVGKLSILFKSHI